MGSSSSVSDRQQQKQMQREKVVKLVKDSELYMENQEKKRSQRQIYLPEEDMEECVDKDDFSELNKQYAKQVSSNSNYSSGSSTQFSTVPNIQSLSQLETNEFRIVNHLRIKDIVLEYQQRGDEDPIAHYKQQLYKKSGFSI